MSQSQSPISPGWTPLARGERDGNMVTRCPAGHIHLDYDNLTVRFQDNDFLIFARMVTEAAARLQGLPWPPPTRFDLKPPANFSPN